MVVEQLRWSSLCSLAHSWIDWKRRRAAAKMQNSSWEHSKLLHLRCRSRWRIHERHSEWCSHPQTDQWLWESNSDMKNCSLWRSSACTEERNSCTCKQIHQHHTFLAYIDNLEEFILWVDRSGNSRTHWECMWGRCSYTSCNPDQHHCQSRYPRRCKWNCTWTHQWSKNCFRLRTNWRELDELQCRSGSFGTSWDRKHTGNRSLCNI